MQTRLARCEPRTLLLDPVLVGLWPDSGNPININGETSDPTLSMASPSPPRIVRICASARLRRFEGPCRLVVLWVSGSLHSVTEPAVLLACVVVHAVPKSRCSNLRI